MTGFSCPTLIKSGFSIFVFDLDVIFGRDRSSFVRTVFSGNNYDNGVITLAVSFDTYGA